MIGPDGREDYGDELRASVEAPEQLVRLATGLWLFAVVQLVCLVVLFAVLAYAVVSAWADNRIRLNGFRDVYWQFVALFLAGGWNGILIWGAGRLERCQGYRSCVTIAAMSVVPIPCCLLVIFTIPLGICVLAELSSDEVRLAFERADRRRQLAPPSDRGSTPDA